MVLAEDGVVVDLVDGRARIVGKVPCGYVYVDGSSVGDVTESSLKDRRILRDEGFISVVVVVDSVTGKVQGGPEIHARGFAEDDSVFDDVRLQGGAGARQGRLRRHRRQQAARAAGPAHRRQVGERHLPAAADDHPARGGGLSVPAGVDEAGVRRLLSALEDMRDGRFRSRLPETGEGLLAELAVAYNEVAERNARLTAELRRVRRTAGRDGRLTERLDGAGAEGAWAEAYDDANALLDDLVRPVTEVARVIEAVAEGDLSPRIELRSGDRPLRGEFLRIGRTVNTMVDQLALVRRRGDPGGPGGGHRGPPRRPGAGARRLRHLEGPDRLGQLHGGQPDHPGAGHRPGDDGGRQRRPVAEDHVDVRGEILELKNTINTMVDQLSAFADEVTRVAREVGTEGKLGGQAQVPGVAGVWRDLTDSVNGMAGNLTGQVRNIAPVATAVARGDLSPEDHRRRPGRDPGAEEHPQHDGRPALGVRRRGHPGRPRGGHRGQLGGQAEVQGVSGTWKDLTDTVNFMANNLTSQVRNIAAGHDRGGPGRPVPEDHRRRARARSSS